MTKKEVLALFDEAADNLRSEATNANTVAHEEYLFEVAARLETAKATIRSWKVVRV